MHTSAPENSTAMQDIAGNAALDLPHDIDEMLSSFAPAEPAEPADAPAPATAHNSKTPSKVPRFRVKWHADIVLEDRSIHHGVINDISAQGTSICLDNNLRTMKCTLRIHVPPLNLGSSTHIIEVSGKLVYLVHDGSQQLFRAAISFLKFHFESDLAYLRERLSKHQITIPEC